MTCRCIAVMPSISPSHDIPFMNLPVCGNGYDVLVAQVINGHFFGRVIPHCSLFLIWWKNYSLLFNSISLDARLVNLELALPFVVELVPLTGRASVPRVRSQKSATAHQVVVLHTSVRELVARDGHLVWRTLTAQRTLLARRRTVDW